MNWGCCLRVWVILDITDFFVLGKNIYILVPCCCSVGSFNEAVSLSSSMNSLLSIEFVSNGIFSWPLIKWMLFNDIISDNSVLSYGYFAMFFYCYNINISLS